MFCRPNVICRQYYEPYCYLICLLYGYQDYNFSSPGYDELPASIAKQCIENYVVPLTYKINMSLMVGIFPSELKPANVVPIFKSDKVTNYRPISVFGFGLFGCRNNTPRSTLL